MNVMTNSHAKRIGGGTLEDDGRRLQRLEFEMALEIGEAGGRAFPEILQRAADIVGGEILFILPATARTGATGVLRVTEGGQRRFVQVRTGEAGFVISKDEEIEPHLLGFARATVHVLERLRADRSVLAPLVPAAH
jgi:hypothetical protein